MCVGVLKDRLLLTAAPKVDSTILRGSKEGIGVDYPHSIDGIIVTCEDGLGLLLSFPDDHLLITPRSYEVIGIDAIDVETLLTMTVERIDIGSLHSIPQLYGAIGGNRYQLVIGIETKLQSVYVALMRFEGGYQYIALRIPKLDGRVAAACS